MEFNRWQEQGALVPTAQWPLLTGNASDESDLSRRWRGPALPKRLLALARTTESGATRVTRAKAIIKRSYGTTVEHPFGTIKARMGATHSLMKTLPRVASEMALHLLAYNLTRVMNIMGIQSLLAAIRA
jgi:hypothetical protein